jgi:hypothetical protein
MSLGPDGLLSRGVIHRGDSSTVFPCKEGNLRDETHSHPRRTCRRNAGSTHRVDLSRIRSPLDSSRVVARVPRFSNDFVGSAREEADRLRVRISELRARGDRWSALAHAALAEAGQLELKVRELDELLGRAPQLRLELQRDVLKGQMLRKEAVRILLERCGLRIPIHYRAWYDLMEAAGLRAGGKNPVATFLTQVSRSPLVERVEGHAGMYQINPEACYERARLKLRQATEQRSKATDDLEALQSRGAAQNVVARASEHARQKRRDHERAERELAELLEAKRQLLDIRLAYVASEQASDASATAPVPSDPVRSMRTNVRRQP